MRPAPTPLPSRWFPWLVGGVLALGTALLYSRSLDYGFLNYDDPSYLTDNAHVQAGLTWDGIVWAFTGRSDYWHPLTWLSHMLDWQLFGASVRGHHAVSVGWHALNAVLVFLVLRRLTGDRWTAVVAAALFAWHPLRVESVVWITERKDVMSGCFFLLTVWSYAGYAESRRAGRPARGAYGRTLALFLAGLMCKPMVVSLPAVLLVLDFWPFGRLAGAPAGQWWAAHRGVILEKLPFVALSAIISAVTMLMQLQHGAFVLEVSPAGRAANAVVSVARYLGKFFWPADLSVCYPHPGSWPAVTFLPALGLVLGVGAVAWWRRRTQPWLLAGWLWFLAMLLPALGLVQVGFQAMADRYTYLPILGWELALLWTLRAIRLPRPVLAGAALAACAACAALTWRQQAVWRDSTTLFSHALACDERNPFAHAFLGYTHLNLNRLDEAGRHATRALELAPRNEVARYTLAVVQADQRQFAGAEANLRTLLAANPGHTLARELHGLVLLNLDRRDEGAAELRHAYGDDPALRRSRLDAARQELGQGRPAAALATLDPVLAADVQDVEARFLRARGLNESGRNDEAWTEATRLLQETPDHPGALTLTGLLLLAGGQPADALARFENVLARSADETSALIGAGRALEQLGRRDEATARILRAQAAAPGAPDAYRVWGDILARRGDFAGAQAAYEKTLSLTPADADTHAALGFVLLLGGRRTEAAAHWQEALRLRPDFPGLRERLRQLQP